MKFPLVFIAAILFISSFPVTSPAKSQTRKSGTSTRKKTPIKRAAKPVPAKVTPAVAPSPVNTTPSGLIYVITRRGGGRQPKAGETVMVHYTGVLTNGLKFDSSVDRGEPFAFELGARQVIAGWDEGIAKLHVGDQATLIIPSSLGYGAKGGGPIPADATLIFIVELVGIQEKSAPN